MSQCLQIAAQCWPIVRADPTGGLLAAAALSALVSTGVGYLARLINPAKKASNLAATTQPASTTFLNTAANTGGPQIGIFGHRRVGGTIIFQGKSGNTTYLVIVIAGSPLSSINGVFVDNALVSFASTINVNNTPWNGDGFNYSMQITLYDGTQVTADSSMMAAFPNWTSQFKGLNCAYAVVAMNPQTLVGTKYAGAYGSGMPNFTFDVCGFKCYDPRDGTQTLGTSSTYKYTSNAALINANYLIHQLGANLPTSLVDWTSVTAAANICDQAVTLKSGSTEPRYQCAVAWTTDERHETVLARIGAAHAGSSFLIGQKYFVRSVASTGLKG